MEIQQLDHQILNAMMFDEKKVSLPTKTKQVAKKKQAKE